ncbi:MAG: hypothetical protein J5I93_09190 [Pirellulaceae bacterium]|nr:hypothetical protein [Pirellulaceae bacterium]
MGNPSVHHRAWLALAASVACLAFTCRLAAEEPFRTWRDRSGSYEVEAKLLARGEDKVQLLKRDGRVVSVPVSALSEADQTFLRESAQAEPNPFAGGTPLPAGTSSSPAGNPTVPAGQGLTLLGPTYEARELPVDGPLAAVDFEEPMPPVEPDTVAAQPGFKPLACLLEQLDAYAVVSAPILIDPAQPAFAVSVHRVGNAVDPATFGRVYLVRAGEKRPFSALNISGTFHMFDHHVPSGRSLAVVGVDSPSQRGGDVVLLNNLASGAPDVIARWKLPGWDRPGFKPKVEFARLLDGNRALVQVNFSLHVWDLVSGRSLMKVEQLRAGSKVQVSANGKYLAIPKSGGCRLVSLETVESMGAQLLGTVPFPGTLTPEVDFSPSGGQLALVAGNQFAVWDLAAARTAHEGTIANPCGRLVGWVGDRHLLTQLGGLIDPALGMPLWNYGLSSNDLARTMPGGVVLIDNTRATALLGLPIPHAPVRQVAEQLSKGDERLMILRPGSEVRLAVKSLPEVDEAAIRNSLQKAVEKAGWRVASQAPIEVLATITRGDEQTLKFREIGAPLSGPYDTASIRPYRASLEVRQGNQLLWTSSSTNMVPPFLRLDEGESLQQAVAKFERADPAYFERLTIPPRILRPEVRAAVGRSRIADGVWRDFFTRN